MPDQHDPFKAFMRELCVSVLVGAIQGATPVVTKAAADGVVSLFNPPKSKPASSGSLTPSQADQP